jgi:hypothetical protein
MKEGIKQLSKEKGHDPIPESYLLCPECDGTWVDASNGQCHCGEHTTSSDFMLCLACALTQHRCQHCGEHVHVKIAQC